MKILDLVANITWEQLSIIIALPSRHSGEVFTMHEDLNFADI